MHAIEGVSHLTLAAPDPAAVAADYERLLGVAATRCTENRDTHVLQTGNVALHVRAPRENEGSGWCSITFRVGDLSRASAELARCGVGVSDAMLDPAATHGVPITLTNHTNSVVPAGGVSLDHVVIRTPNPERAIALYGGRLGLDMRLDRSNPAWNARLIFFRCGNCVVEIAHVLSDGVSDAPDTFGGLSWRVPDIDAMHTRLSGEGFDLSPVRTGRRPGSRVCTVRNRTGGVPTILLGVTPRGREIERPEALMPPFRASGSAAAPA